MNSYVIVRTPTVDGLADLTSEVNNLIGQGYEPLGAPVASGQSIIQALYAPVAKPYMESKTFTEPVVSVVAVAKEVVKGTDKPQKTVKAPKAPKVKE